MKRKIICGLAVLLWVLSVAGVVYAMGIDTKASHIPEEPTTTISEVYIPSEPIPTETIEIVEEEEVIILENIEVERVEPTTLEEANIMLEDAIFRREAALAIYEGLLTLGYQEDHPAVAMSIVDIENAEIAVEYYTEQQVIFEELHKWEIRASEYPVATQVWLYMQNEFGWNDIVCAGIMGNMMAECGGCWTDDLDWQVNKSSGLGMIQWIGSRRQRIISIYGSNPSIEDQLNFMRDELYGTNGVTKQVTDWQLDKIMNASTPEECAFAFATYFERCSENHRAPRRGYAKTAYEYFVG